MNLAYRREYSDSMNSFVHKIQPVRGHDFYGYKVGWSCFLRIELLNPTYVYKCADLLLTGQVIDGLSLQPYESHIPFLLAVMADYNMQGCGWLDLGEAWTRREDVDETVWEGVEVDADVVDIQNRRQLVESLDAHVEVFDALRAGTKVGGLQDLLAEDSARRQRLNIPPYSKLPQVYSQDYHENWEGSDELSVELNNRIENDQDARASCPNTWEKYPTRFNVVPGTAGTASQLKATGVSQPRPSQSLESQDSFSISSTVKQRLVDKHSELIPSILPHNDHLIREAVKHASTILLSEFRGSSSKLGLAGLQLKSSAPSRQEVKRSFGIVAPPVPYYSNPGDVSLFSFTYGGREHHVRSHKPADLPPFERGAGLPYNALHVYTQQPDVLGSRDEGLWSVVELAQRAPSRREVSEWNKNCEASRNSVPSYHFQASSLASRDGSDDELSLLIVEVHLQTRPGKVPSALEDEIAAVFWHFIPAMDSSSHSKISGIITSWPLACSEKNVELVDDENALLFQLIKLTRKLNPDILTGYETSQASWGLINTRFENLQGQTLWSLIGRVHEDRTGPVAALQTPLRGRHIVNLWNVLHREAHLLQFTLEYVVFHILHEHTPHLSFDTLTEWWDSPMYASRVVTYWQTRIQYVARLLHHLEILGRYISQARVIGVDFWSAMTRGSQYMVESALTRLARQENYVFISPSKRQVGQQQALEHIPLVMEPQSAFYTDPVCVLDFRSLYPSIIIAYNLCYSTCLGRVNLWHKRNKLGVLLDFQLEQGIFNKIGRNNLYISPNGIVYVKPNVRRSLLAQMLGEIIDTRQLLNDSRKYETHDTRYQRRLNNQQLALKFIAAVTYGYTSASFSGRMPCAELADSIVATGREILTQSIRIIESCTKWQGTAPKVVYGDTDSLFVQIPGVSREQAFSIGKELSSMVTTAFPDPIFLKLEKVYDPCILQTKKRYVGRSFETLDARAVFDAKGTETIRRDGTPIVQRLERRSLQLLFESCDLSRVKQYLQNEWRRILAGKVPLQEFIFAQQVRLGHYKDSASLPGGAVVSLKRLARDDGALPQYRERVPFIVTAGAPGQRIADRCVAPEDLLENPSLKVDTDYYISQTIIPPLVRLLDLAGANVQEWYRTMARGRRIQPVAAVGGQVSSRLCVSCYERAAINGPGGICDVCASPGKRQQTALELLGRVQSTQLHRTHLWRVCTACSGSTAPSCVSLDCPIFSERRRADASATVSYSQLQILDQF